MKTWTPLQKALRGVVEMAGSQKEFGRICGVPQQVVSKWIYNEGGLPVEYLAVVSRALRVPPTAIRPDLALVLKGRAVPLDAEIPPVVRKSDRIKSQPRNSREVANAA